MLGDYFEYGEHIPQTTINSSLWTTVFSHTTQSVPQGTYLIAFNFAFQNALFSTGYVNFQFLVDGSLIEDSANYLETDPGPGEFDSRETSCSFFQLEFETASSHTIEMQARIGGGTSAGYTRDIRMTFYEEDTTRANWNYYSASGQGTDSESWQDVLSVDIVTPSEGTTYSIWAKANYATQKPVLYPFYRDIVFQVVIDDVTIPEIGIRQYNTEHNDTSRFNCWAKNANCIWIDEGEHVVKIQAKNTGGLGTYPVYWNQQTLRVLRHI
jgi:hypothetical protein